jgi:hypothetical protein
VFGSSANETSPLVKIPKLLPFVGKKLNESAVPFGVPLGGTEAKLADVSVD